MERVIRNRRSSDRLLEPEKQKERVIRTRRSSDKLLEPEKE